jgi:hypothetical protein
MSTGRREAPAKKVPRENFSLKLAAPNTFVTNEGGRSRLPVAQKPFG